MDKILLEDFRCFAGRHEVPVRPLTLLVGENSTGKSSFLAAVRSLNEAWQSQSPPDFNRVPFQLGAFHEIANVRSGKAGRAESFALGLLQREPFFQLRTVFENHDGQPYVSGYEVKLSNARTIRSKGDHYTPLLRQIFDKTAAENITMSDFDAIKDGWFRFFGGPIPPYVSSPIRAEPQRTYELTSDFPQPQGNHVPVIMSRIYGPSDWQQIEDPLVEFAKSAGLFTAIRVRRLGKNESDPFQLQVQYRGRMRNIMDVGYGVSQVLPLVFELIRGQNRRLYMVQQPEVHLHPRAQAELGTLFGALVKAESKRFLIETHSDYIIDRVRMDVRDKKSLRPEDVMILFFEMQNGGVRVHPIEVDEQGNLLNAPPTYRQFFLEEERRFLGV